MFLPLDFITGGSGMREEGAIARKTNGKPVVCRILKDKYDSKVELNHGGFLLLTEGIIMHSIQMGGLVPISLDQLWV